MKNKGSICNICLVIFFLMICGCKTQEPVIQVEEKRVEVPVIDTQIPLTISVLNRLSNSFENISSVIQGVQFVLSGRIRLEHEYWELNDSIEQGGRVKFEDVYTYDVLIVPNQVEGQVLKFEEINGEVILYVGFESISNETMIFSSKRDNPDGRFYLKIDVDEREPLYREEKGMIEYGGQRYKVKYNGDNGPYLLIKSLQIDTDRLNTRKLEGRKVE